MKKIIDGNDGESEDKKILEIPELDGYWDIEDRLYEKYKEMKIEGSLDEEFWGDKNRNESFDID